MSSDWTHWFDFLKQPLPKLMTDSRFYGQAAHFLGGYSVILTVTLLSHSVLAVIIAWLLFAALTATKEFYYDTHYEIPLQTKVGAAIDFISYQVGALLAVIISMLYLFL